MKENHYPGELAYIDSFAGLIPCKVTAVYPSHDIATIVAVRVTAKRGHYQRGDNLMFPHYRIVPRTSIYTHSGTYRIKNNYTWEA